MTQAKTQMCWKCGELFSSELDVCPDDGSRLLPVSSDDRDDPMIGSLFDGRFRIFKKLGEGGMGYVYSARQIDFERDVALKILKSDFVRDENIRKRFMYEARTISKLKHPNVVRIFDFGSAPDESFYMVMELLEGESLADRLAYRFLNYKEIFNTVPPVCGVLSEAHSNDVIHRDLKPENVFLVKVNEQEEFAKLLDFGIAKHLSDTTMTRSGTLWGTPAYMSPEQAKGALVGGPADTYAIGIMLYELICGNLPFHSTTQMGLALKQISLPARRLSTIPGLGNVSKELDDLVNQCLEKDPNKRPDDVKDVGRRLNEIAASFSAEELAIVPAEEVDALALQDWLAAEGTVDEDPSRIPAHLRTLDKLSRDELSGIVDIADDSVSFSLPRRSLNIVAGVVVLAILAFLAVYFVNSHLFVDDVESQTNPHLTASVQGGIDSKTSETAKGKAAIVLETVPKGEKLIAEQPVKGITAAAGNAVTVFLHAQRVAEIMKPEEAFDINGKEEAAKEPEKLVVKKTSKRMRKTRKPKRKKRSSKRKRIMKKVKSDLEKTF